MIGKGIIGKKKQAPKQTGDNTTEPVPAAIDEDYEDGDIATPKRDCSGNDDEPL